MNKLTTYGLAGAISICASLTAMPSLVYADGCTATEGSEEYTYVLSGCADNTIINADIYKVVNGTKSPVASSLDLSGNLDGDTIDMSSIFEGYEYGEYAVELFEGTAADPIAEFTVVKEAPVYSVEEGDSKYTYILSELTDNTTVQVDISGGNLTSPRTINVSPDYLNGNKVDLSSYVEDELDYGEYTIEFFESSNASDPFGSFTINKVAPVCSAAEGSAKYKFILSDCENSEITVDITLPSGEIYNHGFTSIAPYLNGDEVDFTELFDDFEDGEYKIEFFVGDAEQEFATFTVTKNTESEETDPAEPADPTEGNEEETGSTTAESKKVSTPDTGSMSAFENGSANVSALSMLATAVALTSIAYAAKKSLRQ